MPLTIRPAVPADLPALAALEQACFSHPWSENGLAETLQNGRSVFLAAEREGEVLGYLGMEFVLDEGSITNVAVFPGCRRQGVADALVTGLLHRAAAIGLATVTLEVRQSNAPAIALYHKHGFVPVGRRKNGLIVTREEADGSNPEVVFVSNALSLDRLKKAGIAALAGLFLFWRITRLIRRITRRHRKED